MKPNQIRARINNNKTKNKRKEMNSLQRMMKSTYEKQRYESIENFRTGNCTMRIFGLDVRLQFPRVGTVLLIKSINAAN